MWGYRGTVVTRRKRGIFGWFFLLLFIGFNLLMLWIAGAGYGLLGHVPMPSANVVTLGVAIGVAAFLVCWLLEFLLLGLFALLTRGRKVTAAETR
jgi:uncharacterized membrane protein (DUF485 family)